MLGTCKGAPRYSGTADPTQTMLRVFVWFAGLLAAECPSCHPTITANTIFRDCTFHGCVAMPQADVMDTQPYGGAIFLDDGSLALGIASCVFDSCCSPGGGGALSVGCGSFSMTNTSGRNCSAVSFSFGSVSVCPVAESGGDCAVHGFSAVSCRADTVDSMLLFYGPWEGGYCGVPAASVAGRSLLASLNSSANYAGEHGSGLSALGFAGLSIMYPLISSNAAGACLWWAYGEGACSCGVVVNNSCSRAYNAVVYMMVSMSAVNCIFQANTAESFLASETDPSVKLSFVGCVFDRSVLRVTGSQGPSVTIIVEGSIFRAQSTVLPACVPPSPSARASQGPTLMELALGIGLPGLFLVVVLIVIAVKLAAERKKEGPEQAPPFELHFEAAFIAAVKDKQPEGVDKDDQEEHPVVGEGEATSEVCPLDGVRPFV
jgi:hypothetical protein